MTFYHDKVSTHLALIRPFFAVVALILCIGAGLFFVPDLVAPRWLWPLAPFNMRFLGALYLTELVVAVMLLLQSAPLARIVTAASLPFVAIVSVVSLLYPNQFDWQRPATWAWFTIYIGSTLVLLYLLWRYREQRRPRPIPLPPAWQLYLWAEAFVLLLYSLGLLIAPATFSAFWPWPVDAFHGRMYSALFVTFAVGAFMLARAAAPLELLTLSLAQITFGLFAILGLIIVDAAAQRVDWSAPGVWLWIGALAILFITGVAMAWQARRLRTGRVFNL